MGDNRGMAQHTPTNERTAMSRKHYVAVAAAIAARKSQHTDDSPMDAMYRIAMRDITTDLAAIFKLDNPRFDVDRFKHAAGWYN